MPDDAKPEERRDDREAKVGLIGEKVLDRREHAVARPALGGSCALVVEAALGDPGHAGNEEGVVGERLAVAGRDPVRVVVAVAAPQRPADVVQEQQRQLAAGPLGDQAQLLADREVVVVAVDDHGVGELEPRQRVVAGLDDQLQLGAGPRELEQPIARRRVDRGDPLDAGRCRPAEQLLGEQAVLRADLGDRAHLRGFQRPEDDLAEVRERAVEAVEVVGCGPAALCVHGSSSCREASCLGPNASRRPAGVSARARARGSAGCAPASGCRAPRRGCPARR